MSWWCSWLGHKYISASTATRSSLWFIFLSDFQLQPKIHGLDNALTVGQGSHLLTCRVEYYWTEEVTFFWTLNDENLHHIPQKPARHPDNSATFSSELSHEFEEKDDHARLICTVSTTGEAPTTSSTVATIDMKCKQKSLRREFAIFIACLCSSLIVMSDTIPDNKSGAVAIWDIPPKLILMSNLMISCLSITSISVAPFANMVYTLIPAW